MNIGQKYRASNQVDEKKPSLLEIDEGNSAIDV